LYFIEDVVAYLPCGRTFFYDEILSDSDKSDIIKKELENNRIATKIKLRKKWEDSQSAPLQIGLMKLLGTEEEVERLNGSKQRIDHTTNGKDINSIDLSKLDDATLKKLDEARANDNE
jgi:hypothetical protein